MWLLSESFPQFIDVINTVITIFIDYWISRLFFQTIFLSFWSYHKLCSNNHFNTIWKALVSRAGPQAKTIPRLATALTHRGKKSSWSTSCVVLSSSGTTRSTRKVRAHPCRPRPAEKGDLHFGVYHTERVDWGRESVLRGQDQITSGETQEQRVGEGGGYLSIYEAHYVTGGGGGKGSK